LKASTYCFKTSASLLGASTASSFSLAGACRAFYLEAGAMPNF
jgi:hypothetical protein